MKSTKRIALLTLAATAIVIFWLAPGINQATADEYTRLYEDTDHYTHVAKDTARQAKRTSPPPKHNSRFEKQREKEAKKLTREIYKVDKKVYKRETIRPKDKNFKLKASMFSRGAQFMEKEAIVVLDSAKEKAAVDTIAREL